MDIDDVYDELIEITSAVGAQVDVPVEAEAFFSSMVESFAGDKIEFIRFIKSHIQILFKNLGAQPVWLQEGEWQFSQGKPMTFVGQINVPAAATGMHDEAAFFTFWNPLNGETKVVIQLA